VYKETWSLNEKMIYSIGWNDAVKAALKLIERYDDEGFTTNTYDAVAKLDLSMQACDD
jgi:hypothetical protein